jgi:radical SAM peptide maturase (CXXX-repeat target family)/CXXX repeat peptide maturase
MNNFKIIKMGLLGSEWMSGMAKTITFCVTEDCNFACKYCYMTGKNNMGKMSFETAKRAVDYILTSSDDEFDKAGVIWEFIGGEPFLEIDLIEKICDYIKINMLRLDHKWFNAYRFSISTNGYLYGTPKVQNYIKKNHGHLSIGISIDGNKIKHDLQRVKKDGTGTYDDIVKNIPLWQSQFPGATTKSTFSHSDLPLLKESIIHLWNLGLNLIPANVVFENVWEEGDDIIFENQLKELADYIIENELWWDYSVRFFRPDIGFPLAKKDLDLNFCGSGKMLAIDCKGDFYPCIRFYDISLNNRKGRKIGNIETGLDNDKIRPFSLLSLESQSTDECIHCSVASGCAWCTGGNYDFADSDTIYQRSVFNCKMHKANVRANEYFWNRLSEALGYMPDERLTHISLALQKQKKFLYLILSDKVVPHCSYRNYKKTSELMSDQTIQKCLEFASYNEFTPVFLGEFKNPLKSNLKHGYYQILGWNSTKEYNRTEIPVFDNKVEDFSDQIHECILILNKENVSHLYEFSTKLFGKSSKINLKLENISNWTEETLKLYDDQLDKLNSVILDSYKEGNPFEFNVLTDILHLDSLEDCCSGETSFSVAPNGKIYICPAFYFDNSENSVGNLEDGIKIINNYLLEVKKSPICIKCDAFHCNRCKFLNKKCTNEINIPSKMQCVISHIERNKSKSLQLSIKKECDVDFNRIIKDINYLDPIENQLTKEKRFIGCI